MQQSNDPGGGDKHDARLPPQGGSFCWPLLGTAPAEPGGHGHFEVLVDLGMAVPARAVQGVRDGMNAGRAGRCQRAPVYQ